MSEDEFEKAFIGSFKKTITMNPGMSALELALTIGAFGSPKDAALKIKAGGNIFSLEVPENPVFNTGY